MDKPNVPILQKNLTPLKWTESFKNCLNHTFGIRKCALSYLIRDEVIPENEIDDPQLPYKLYGKSGSIIDEFM